MRMNKLFDAFTVRKYRFYVDEKDLDQFKLMLCEAKLSNRRENGVSTVNLRFDNLHPLKVADWLITVYLTNEQFCALLLECKQSKISLYNYFQNHANLTYKVEKES